MLRHTRNAEVVADAADAEHQRVVRDRSLGQDLGAALGGNYVNRFSIQGRSYKVIPQVGDAERRDASRLLDLKVMGPDGNLIPIPDLPDHVARAIKEFEGFLSFYPRHEISDLVQFRLAMSYYDQTDLPFYYWLASTFALNDRHFASVRSGTNTSSTSMPCASFSGSFSVRRASTFTSPKRESTPAITRSRPSLAANSVRPE